MKTAIFAYLLVIAFCGFVAFVPVGQAEALQKANNPLPLKTFVQTVKSVQNKVSLKINALVTAKPQSDFKNTITSNTQEDKVSIKGPGYGGFGSSLRLNGDGTGVNFPPLFANSQVLTFEGWFKADDFTSTNPESRYIYSQVSNYNNGSFTENTLRIEGKSGLAQGKGAKMIASFYDNNNSQPNFIWVNDPVFVTSTWHHVAVTRDGGTAYLFLDGQEKGRVFYGNTGTQWNDPKSLIVGGYAERDLGDRGFAVYQGWKGEIDEIRVSNIARYSINFAVKTNIFGIDGNTLALYHLDGSFNDSVAISGDGQGVGSVSFITSTVPYLPIPADPYITSIVIPPCTSSSCSIISTAIINGENFGTYTHVDALGFDGRVFTEDSLTPDGYHYVTLVGRTLPHQIIMDFRSLPCQSYNLLVFNQSTTPASISIKNTAGKDVHIQGGGPVFTPGYCPRG